MAKLPQIVLWQTYLSFTGNLPNNVAANLPHTVKLPLFHGALETWYQLLVQVSQAVKAGNRILLRLIDSCPDL